MHEIKGNANFSQESHLEDPQWSLSMVQGFGLAFSVFCSLCGCAFLELHTTLVVEGLFAFLVWAVF
jgi:hypothetical protein